MTSGQAERWPAPPSHFISIQSLSTLSTLYLQSYYLHYLHYLQSYCLYYLFADFHSFSIRSGAGQGGGGHVTVLQFAQMKLQFSWSPSNWDAGTVSSAPEITPALQKYLLSTANDHLRKYMIVLNTLLAYLCRCYVNTQFIPSCFVR